MSTINKQRFLLKLLPKPSKKQLVLVTGARQTGKTTLVKEAYPTLNYLNLDAPEIREQLLKLPSTRWGKTLGRSVLDEVQKLPQAFEKIKYAYDEKQIDFSVLLGSSQILLLQKISESLAGRIGIYELFPLLLAELYTAENQQLEEPLFDRILDSSSQSALAQLMDNQADILFGESEQTRIDAQNHLLKHGGMPALLHIPENECGKWLRDYEYTYLQRDLADLARLGDLEPFRRLQKLAAARATKLLNYSELARDAGISTDSARRYLEYLKISYQVMLLQPYSTNLTSTVIKTPKLYWLDLGILRQLTNQPEVVNGEIFENMVVSEAIKWIRTMQKNVELFFYRTQSGFEVDLLIQTQYGVIGVEIKSANKASSSDIKHLRELAKVLDKKWLGGFLIYQGNLIEKMTDSIWAIPSYRLF